ncbi:hypothetical protein XENTR_v10008373 [Xenopus tropicalis]|nr:hypothetical protein XENTR_v10008373 [Xenopus tropicalis]
MAAGTGKHKLLNIGPTEPWSIREKLCLASSVMRSGDQNWVSVSRAIKPFAEPGRPPDWFSQKHCASQYSELLETTETPKRKRGERGEVVETVEDVIVRKLTAERIEELKKMIKETQEKYRKLKKEAELIQSGHLDSKLEDLWNETLAKKKQEEEEAEMKRKATEAAYQVRLAAKNIPRRTSTMSRSSVGSSSPGGEFGLVDLTPINNEEGSVGVSVGSLSSTSVPTFIGIPDTPPPASAPPESPLTPVMDDSPQKKMAGQKATPPPSPLLSELLKKGSLLPSSPRLVWNPDPGDRRECPETSHSNREEHLLGQNFLPYSFPSFQVSEGEMALTSGNSANSGVLMDVGVLPTLHGGDIHSVPGTIPASPAASVTQQDSNDSASDPHSISVSMDSSDISMIIDSINKECLASSDGVRQSKDETSEGKADLDLSEKMDMEELDFETVGDIIAIIEDKDDHPEVLDVAAVEAALSFCEENDDPQALAGPWDQPVQEHTSNRDTLGQSLISGAKESESLMNIIEMSHEIKAEPPEPDLEPTQEEAISLTSQPVYLGHTEDLKEQRGNTENEHVKEEEVDQVKTEEPYHEAPQSQVFPKEEEAEMGIEQTPLVTGAR